MKTRSWKVFLVVCLLVVRSYRDICLHFMLWSNSDYLVLTPKTYFPLDVCLLVSFSVMSLYQNAHITKINILLFCCYKHDLKVAPVTWLYYMNWLKQLFSEHNYEVLSWISIIGSKWLSHASFSTMSLRGWSEETVGYIMSWDIYLLEIFPAVFVPLMFHFTLGCIRRIGGLKPLDLIPPSKFYTGQLNVVFFSGVEPRITGYLKKKSYSLACIISFLGIIDTGTYYSLLWDRTLCCFLIYLFLLC